MDKGAHHRGAIIPLSTLVEHAIDQAVSDMNWSFGEQYGTTSAEKLALSVVRAAVTIVNGQIEPHIKAKPLRDDEEFVAWCKERAVIWGIMLDDRVDAQSDKQSLALIVNEVCKRWDTGGFIHFVRDKTEAESLSQNLRELGNMIARLAEERTAPASEKSPGRDIFCALCGRPLGHIAPGSRLRRGMKFLCGTCPKADESAPEQR